MQNKIIFMIIFSLALTAFVSAMEANQNITPLLEKAEALKYAEKYEEAEKLYDEVLKIDPDDLEAQKGKQDCMVMLYPMPPVQHLMPTMIDPEYLELIKKAEEAKTPWDKRHAENAIELYAVKYTGKVFGEQSKEWDKKADKIVTDGINKVKNGSDPEVTYLATDNELRKLQEAAHRSWKGHGPDIYPEVIAKLNKYYDENDLFNPSQPLTLSFTTSPEVTKEGQVVDLTVSLTNKLSVPLILMACQLEDLRYRTFSWQKPMYGDLSYDKEKNIYHYNPLAQQETYNYFNVGLLFPGQTTIFSKKARIPKPKPTVIISYYLLGKETLKHVYFEEDPKKAIGIFSPADMKKLKPLSVAKSFLVDEKGNFPSRDTIVFDYQERAPREQVFILGTKEK